MVEKNSIFFTIFGSQYSKLFGQWKVCWFTWLLLTLHIFEGSKIEINGYLKLKI